jgi:hypothetical protein
VRGPHAANEAQRKMGDRQIIESVPWANIAKGLAGVVLPTGGSTALLYFVPSFTSINPKIVQDIWFPTILAMAVASGLVLFSSLRRNADPRFTPGFISAGMFIICLILLLALVGEMIRTSAAANAFLARIFLLGVFAGISGFGAWCLAWFLNRPA